MAASHQQVLASYGSSFSPLSLNPLFWLDAGSLTLADGDPVDTWTDRSGNSKNFTGADTARPIFKTGIINGLPVVRSDGVDDQLDSASASSVKSIAIVGKYSSSTIVANTPGLLTGMSAPNNTYIVGGGAGQTIWSVFPGDVSYWKNGVSTAYNTSGAMPMNAFTRMVWTATTARNYTWRIGRNKLGSVSFWLGDVAEIIACSTEWTTTERQNIETYFANKYAL